MGTAVEVLQLGKKKYMSRNSFSQRCEGGGMLLLFFSLLFLRSRGHGNQDLSLLLRRT